LNFIAAWKAQAFFALGIFLWRPPLLDLIVFVSWLWTIGRIVRGGLRLAEAHGVP